MKYLIFCMLCFFSGVGMPTFFDLTFKTYPSWVMYLCSGTLGALGGYYLL